MAGVGVQEVPLLLSLLGAMKGKDCYSVRADIGQVSEANLSKSGLPMTDSLKYHSQTCPQLASCSLCVITHASLPSLPLVSAVAHSRESLLR